MKKYKSKSVRGILTSANFCAKKNQKRQNDDRPFPEEDSLVFPKENMYDRIILPGKSYHFGHFVNNPDGKLSALIIIFNGPNILS